MKKHLLILILALSTLSAFAQITGIHATDARLCFHGRVLRTASDVTADWTGVYVHAHFLGNYLAVRLSDTGKNYYNLYIDREMTAEPDRIICTTGDTTVVLFTARRPKEHTVTLYKRTEGEQGRTTFHEFLVQGELLEAQPYKVRQIEFIGDSYTCGYGAENSTQHDHFTPQTETSAKTYAAIIARYFDADYRLIAHSGMGIARNYNSKFPDWYMPDRYEQIFDMDSTAAMRWTADTTIFRPQITVILLGGNDFSTGRQPEYDAFAHNYQRLLQTIKTNYGTSHPVVCCVKKGVPTLTEYVRQVVEQCHLPEVYFCPFYDGLFHDDERNLGADWHPNYEGHRKAAHVLIPYISTITGWELQDKKL
ncbi:MAG: GDSL-type esterase/lipase family protein [Paludibacteraceae bacterium]|nr:GDSL-type esterase/lipase family protein [Paludibacteraceae bacterium]